MGNMKVVIGGTIDTTQTWSVGLWVINGDFDQPTQAAMTDYLNAIDGPVALWWRTGTPSCVNITAADVELVSLRAYAQVNPNTPSTAVAELLYGSPIAGTNSGVLSTRESMVASLLTGAPGRSRRGRIYIPACGAALTNHQFSATDVDDVAEATATLLEAMQAGVTGWTAGTVAVFGKNGPNPITQVRVDSKVDTQRRRSDKIGATDVATYPVT